MISLKVVSRTTKPTPGKKDSFWDSLSRAEQDQYLKDHPDSKYKTATKKPKNAPSKKGAEAPAAKPKKLTDIIKNFHADQKKFFESEQHKPDSEERTKLAGLVERKKEGFKKSIKSEVKEWHHAMDGIRELAKGGKLDDHHKSALKAISIHSGIVIGDIALAGGMATLGAAVTAFGSGFLTHTLGIHAGKTAIWASTMKDFDKMTDEELLDWYVDNMAKSVKTANIPIKNWLSAVTNKGKKNAKPKSKK